MASVVVLDAGVLIALMNSKDAHHDWALGIFKQSLSSELFMSALTFAEVLVHPARNGQSDLFLKNIEKLGLKVVDVSKADAVELAEIRSQSKLRMPDAVVAHTAIKRSAALATTDGQLRRTAETMQLPVFYPAGV